MEQHYPDVVRCTLSPEERRVPVSENGTPLVIKPLKSSSKAFLREFLVTHSREILNDAAQHGAVLLRGFDLESPQDFEQQILSIRGMRGVRDILLSEQGRTIQEGTRFVFHTNTLFKTGGGLTFGVFHTENYFLPDVPRYISFFCRRPGTLGGETGLINTAKVYDDLPEVTQSRLERGPCLVCLHPAAEIMSRYQLSPQSMDEFYRGAGLPVVTVDDVRHLAIYKPNVIQHPMTGEKSLAINFGYIDGLEKPLCEAFLADYSGWRWLPHRLVWQVSWLQQLYERHYLRRVKKTGAAYLRKAVSPVSDARTLTTLFSPDEIQPLAASMRRRYSSFLWQRGDVLIVDNLKLAHSGMAGYGDRELSVMLCNVVPLPASGLGSGLYVVPSNDSRESLGAQVERFRVEVDSAA